MGDSQPERADQNRRWLQTLDDFEEEKIIRDAVARNQLKGDKQFVDEIEQRVGRRVELRGRGRPAGLGD